MQTTGEAVQPLGGGYGSAGPTEGVIYGEIKRWGGNCWGRILAVASSVGIKCTARAKPQGSFPQDTLHAKIERSDAFLSRGNGCPNPDVACTVDD